MISKTVLSVSFVLINRALFLTLHFCPHVVDVHSVYRAFNTVLISTAAIPQHLLCCMQFIFIEMQLWNRRAIEWNGMEWIGMDWMQEKVEEILKLPEYHLILAFNTCKH